MSSTIEKLVKEKWLDLEIKCSYAIRGLVKLNNYYLYKKTYTKAFRFRCYVWY